MKENIKNKARKLYKKPLIEEVELKPEEAVLTGCKTTLTGGPDTSPCRDIAGRCKNTGS